MTFASDFDNSNVERPRWAIVTAIALIVGAPLTIQMGTLITDPNAYGIGYFAWTMFAR